MPVITDIAECDANNGGCGQFCREFQGSFQCYCGVGYTIATDGRNCDGNKLLRINALQA